MKKLQEELKEAIEKYKLTDEEVLEISRRLEKKICEEQRKRLKDWIKK